MVLVHCVIVREGLPTFYTEVRVGHLGMDVSNVQVELHRGCKRFSPVWRTVAALQAGLDRAAGLLVKFEGFRGDQDFPTVRTF